MLHDITSPTRVPPQDPSATGPAVVHSSAGGAREAAAAGPGPASSAFLDQEKENRERGAERPWCPEREEASPGDLVITPAGAGGSFDPRGRRFKDVCRVDDLREVIRHVPGRWLLVTLTVDRRGFLGPEVAYLVGNERVREVARALEATLYVCGFEVQGKTGAGWPHWHLMLKVPDGLEVGECRRRVERAWTTMAESIDQDTGEVTRSRERIGRQLQVEWANDRNAAGTYALKYLTKPWEAVPDWMGEGRRQIRKLRASSSFFDLLERLHRHVRHRGGRQVSTRGRKPARTLFERMASSGSYSNVFRVDQDGRLRWEATLPVPSTGYFDLALRPDVRALAAGTPHETWDRARLVVSDGLVRQLRLNGAYWRARSSRYIGERLARFRAEWREMQERRNGTVATVEVDGEFRPESVVAGVVADDAAGRGASTQVCQGWEARSGPAMVRRPGEVPAGVAGPVIPEFCSASAIC